MKYDKCIYQTCQKKPNRLNLLVSCCFIFPWHLNINACMLITCIKLRKKQNVCAHLFPGYSDRCWRFSLDPLPQLTALKSIHFFDKPIFPVITFCLVFSPMLARNEEGLNLIWSLIKVSYNRIWRVLFYSINNVISSLHSPYLL